MAHPNTSCPDCGAQPGQLHQRGCDVERCPACGHQAISCGCIYEYCGLDQDTLEDHHPDVYEQGPTDEMYARWDAAWGKRRLPWAGEWPGVAECREFGWYSKWDEQSSRWVRCGADEPGANEDLNRLGTSARWDIDRGRFVLP